MAADMAADKPGDKAGEMAGTGAERRAWPFLVARGRERGYRTLLAPDFLVAERGYGVLDDSVVPDPEEDRASVITVVTSTGRALTVAHATHAVTAADLAEPGTEAGEREPRDRHSRPLQLIYGFVCADARVSAVHPDDLAACRETALGVYRRFLGDEAGFGVEAGRGFVPRTRLAPRPPAPPAASDLPVRSLAAGAGDPDPPRPLPAFGSLLLLGAIVLVIAVLAGMWFSAQKPKTGEVCPTVQASVSAGRTPEPLPSGCPTPPAGEPPGEPAGEH